MSELVENQFNKTSKHAFTLDDLEGSSSIKVTDLVAIQCSSGKCQQSRSTEEDSSGNSDESRHSMLGDKTPETMGEIETTMTSLPLPMTTASPPATEADDGGELPMTTTLAEEAEIDDETKEKELDSSSNHSIIPWLCDFEADEDQCLLDSDEDDDSEVEIDRCDASRCVNVGSTGGCQDLARPSRSGSGGESSRYGGHSKRELKYADSRRNGMKETGGRGLSDPRSEEVHIATGKDRGDSGYGWTGSQDRDSTSSDECLSIRICKTTPAFLRINPRNAHSPDDGDSTGGRALLSRTLDQVRRRLMDDLSPVLPDYENDIKEIESAKLRSTYLKNLLVLGIGFMLVFTSFCALRSLQSSINHDGGLGLAALSCMNATFAVGCVFATTVVQRVRPKRAIMISLLGHLLYTVANVHATFYTLLPATAVIGFTMATLFVAQGTYLTSIAVTYAAVSGKKHEHIVGLFNGFFLFMIQIAQIFGNLISSTVFSFFADEAPNAETAAATVRGSDGSPIVETNGTSNESLAGSGTWRNGTTCGSGYCHVFLIEPLNLRLYGDTVVILIAVFVVISASGMTIIGLFLDKLDVIFHQSKRSLASQLCAIVRLHRDRRLTLCVPLMTFLGMQEAFVYGEFTKGYVTCPLGVHMIGYVMICFAGSASLSSVTIGYLQKYLPRSLIMTAGAILHLVVMAFLFLWQPSANDVLLIFVMSGLLGVADAVWQTEICSLCGVLFDRRHREASFSCLRMYQSVGLCLALGYAQFLCVDVKIVILAVVMAIALVAYFGMEFSIKSKHGQQDVREPASV